MSKRLLLIDDDSDDRDLFYEVLQDIDTTLDCQLEDSCQEALQKLEKRQIAHPDLIFLDINMPIMNGWECLTQLKKERNHESIPVIMYSTSDHIADQDKAHQLGALGLVTKPSEYKKLKTLLNRILHHLETDTLTRQVIRSIV
ncbi:response regulator [Spirosoma sp. BT702]|uniref:Response regulator n=1 Tax=Spirosoma profusum TaxID=2771354 RepID=A0A926Y3I8_9BACT|nr:response regulator [Spirosoma profusum]MBD2703443.1 response regulator [Spirosoma profusum]